MNVNGGTGRFFPGRIFFDHLPKTGGTAVAEWLRQSLGSGCVTRGHMWGRNRDLIRQFGGRFSVISAHTHFRRGDGLDPRYRYVTLLRDPIDRTLSWLYFVAENSGHTAADHDQTAVRVRRFLDSEGQDVDENLLSEVSNVYCRHFAAIFDGSPESPGDPASSLAAIQAYSVAGIYEDMPAFLAEFGALVGLPAPESIPRVHVTARRPAVKDISPTMRERIAALNELDLNLYTNFAGWKRHIGPQQSDNGQSGLPAPQWEPYEAPKGRASTAAEFALKNASLSGGKTHPQGALVCFEFEFSLASAFENLEVGIHLHDDIGRVAFGTNTTLLRCAANDARQGAHRARFYLALNLPEGEYTAGFAVAVVAPAPPRELAWFDELLSFHVTSPAVRQGVGYAEMPAEASCVWISGR